MGQEGKMVAGKWRQLYLNNNKEKEEEKGKKKKRHRAYLPAAFRLLFSCTRAAARV